MKRILIVLFCLISLVSKAQVYQEMPQYGYRANRMAFDSTLQIPTVCGVPTLKSNVTKKAAIAFDSCNNKFYTYNPKTKVWSIVSGGAVSDTPTLQMVTTKGDTTNKNIYLIYDTIGWHNALTLFAKTDSGERPKIEIASANGLTRITPDYSYINDASNNQLQLNSQGLNFNNPNNYNVIGNIYNGYHFFNLYQSDTSKHNDTLATLSNIRNSATTIDTANKWINSLYRKNGVDSIFYKIGETEYKIKDSIGQGNGRFGNDTATIVMAKIHNDAGVQLTNGKVVRWASSGSNSDIPSVKLANNKHDSSSANTLGFVVGTINVNDTGYVILSGKIEKLNTSAFANGDIIYLDSTNGEWTKSKPQAPLHLVYLGVVIKANGGNGSIFVKCQNGYELDEIHDVQINSKINNQILVYSDTQKVWKNRNVYSVVDTSSTIATKTDVANKVNISDTASMLTNYQKSATAMKYTDTASMLTNYAKTSAINLKVNISDTASMLSPYARTLSLSSYLLKSDSTIFYPIYRSDSSRTNIYNALNGKQSSLTFSTGLTNTSGTITNNLSVGVSGGQTIIGGTAASNNLTLSSTSNATKGKIIFGTASAYDQANDRIGIGTTSPTNPLDVIRGGAGTMSRNTYESGSYVYNGDMKVGVYTASTNSAHGAAISFGQTNLTANSRYPGFDMQYVYSSTVASNAWRVNYTERSSAGAVQNYTANILQAYADGSVIINPTTSGVTASAKLLIGTSTNAGYMLDVNGTARATQFYLSALNTAPASASATGTTGEIRIDANYIYICTATNTWKRVAIATW